ncbi:MAG: aminotransferase class V-fold PLP-dependent enzyme [Salinibacter sp.]
MAIDVEQVRADTPGTANVLHFNNAGAALPPQPVLNAQIHHLRREAEIGGYEAAAEAEAALHDTYSSIARMLGCAPDEVALVENATRAWDMAFYGLSFDEGDRILTSRAAYASNHIACLQVAERTGAAVEVVPSTPAGAIDVDALRTRMDDRVALIALTHMPTNGGLVNPAAQVGSVAQEAGVPFLLDACQSAGQMPLPVDEIGCTMLSATGRKYLRGPRGTGFLYVRRDWIERIEPPLLDLHAATWTGPDTYEVHSDARRFETWESHVAGQVALGTAVEYAQARGLSAIRDRVRSLAASLRTALAAVPGVTVQDQGHVRSGITTFTAEQMNAEAIQSALRERNVNVSVSPPASTRLDADARALPALVRASVHYYNTEAEISRFTNVLHDVLASADSATERAARS